MIAVSEAKPLVFAFAVCGGALTYLQVPDEPNWYVFGLIAGLCLLGFAALTRDWGNVIARFVLLVLCGLLLGFCAGKVRMALVEAPVVSQTQGPLMIEGWVSEIEPASRGVRLRIRPHAAAGIPSSQLPDEIRLTHRLDLKVYPGRFVRCWAVLRPPPGPAVPGDYDFRRQAWFQGLGAVGYVQGRCRGGTLGPPADRSRRTALEIGAERRQLAEYVKRVSGERAGGFAAALVSGDRSFMSQDDQEALRASGLAHLLAISGLHLGIVGGLVYLIVRRGLGFIAPISLRIPVQKPAAIAALMAITVYLIISGASVSTQRAFIMSAVFFSAILIDRPALSLRSFSIALLAVVLIAPESVVAPGFQMSFAATGILIAIYEAWAQRRTVPLQGFVSRGVFAGKSLIVTSVAASAATAPFALFHFERIAPLGLIANLLAMPVVSLASVPSAGLALVLAPFGRANIGLSLFGKSLELVLVIAEWSSNAGADMAPAIKQMPVSSLIACIGALIAVVLFRRWLRALLTVSAICVAAMIWAVAPTPDIYWAPSGTAYFKADSGRYHQIDVVDGDGLGSLALGESSTVPLCDQAACSYQLDGMKRLLISHGDVTAQNCGDFDIVLAVSDAEQTAIECSNVISWADILAKGGVSARIGSEQLYRRHVQTCSRRPWRRCNDFADAAQP